MIRLEVAQAWVSPLALTLALAAACDGASGSGPDDPAAGVSDAGGGQTDATPHDGGGELGDPDSAADAARDEGSGSRDAPWAGDSDAGEDAPTGDSDAARDRRVVPDWPPPDCRANTAPPPERPAVDQAPTLPWLRVDGLRLVDEEGAPVALRGVNFGSWLLIESWMVGLGELDEGAFLEEFEAEARRLGLATLFAAAKATNGLAWLVTQRAHRVLVHEWRQFMFREATEEQLEAVEELWAWFDAAGWVFEEASLWSFLGQRFGVARAEELRVAWGRSFITEVDFARAAALGFNAVRLPLGAETLESTTTEGVAWREEGWARLSDALRWARTHGLYLIIDLHGAPGGQSAEWHTGLSNGGALFSDPACLDRAAHLWSALAGYVAGDPHGAILDLLNEPSGSPNRDAWVRVHQRLYDAARSANDRAIIMAEDGYRGQRNIAGPAELGWENAVFSLHFYPDSASPEGYERALDGSLAEWAPAWGERFGCPLIVGEFNAELDRPAGVEAMDRALRLFNERGAHWTIWTWKFWSSASVWGALTPAGGDARIPLRDAPYDAILRGIESTRSDNFRVEDAYGAALGARAADPTRPLALAGETP